MARLNEQVLYDLRDANDPRLVPFIQLLESGNLTIPPYDANNVAKLYGMINKHFGIVIHSPILSNSPSQKK